MTELNRKIIVPEEPDFFSEAQYLMSANFEHLEKAEPDDLPWHQQPLIKRLDGFTLTAEEISALYPDVMAYTARCREQAAALLAGKTDLAALHQVCTQDAEGQRGQYFLIGALNYMQARSAGEMSWKDLARGAVLQLWEMAGNLEQLEGLEEQAVEEMISPQLKMDAVFSAVSQAPVDDGERMTLLRFFQQLDSWLPQLQEMLSQLEAICREAWPLIKPRYQEKARELIREGTASEPFKWLKRMDADLSAVRPEDPITIQIWLTIYSGLGFRFVMDKKVPLKVMMGLLFSELSALQVKQQARNQLTERQLKALSDPSRLAIVRGLAEGEKYVQQLADSLNLSPATLSHHLNLLLQSLLVGVRVEGRRSYYGLNREELGELANDLMSLSQWGEEKA